MCTLIYIDCTIKKKTKENYIHTQEEFRSIYLDDEDNLSDTIKKLKDSLHEKYHQACDEWLALNGMFKYLKKNSVFGKEPVYANFSIIKNTEETS